MQLTEKAQSSKINASNKASLKNATTSPVGKTGFLPLLRLLAEGCDLNASGHNFYCTLGATKKGDALTLSVNLDGDRQTFYGADLLDLAMQVAAVTDAL